MFYRVSSYYEMMVVMVRPSEWSGKVISSIRTPKNHFEWFFFHKGKKQQTEDGIRTYWEHQGGLQRMFWTKMSHIATKLKGEYHEMFSKMKEWAKVKMLWLVTMTTIHWGNFLLSACYNYHDENTAVWHTDKAIFYCKWELIFCLSAFSKSKFIANTFFQNSSDNHCLKTKKVFTLNFHKTTTTIIKWNKWL